MSFPFRFAMILELGAAAFSFIASILVVVMFSVAARGTIFAALSAVGLLTAFAGGGLAAPFALARERRYLLIVLLLLGLAVGIVGPPLISPSLMLEPGYGAFVVLFLASHVAHFVMFAATASLLPEVSLLIRFAYPVSLVVFLVALSSLHNDALVLAAYVLASCLCSFMAILALRKPRLRVASNSESVPLRRWVILHYYISGIVFSAMTSLPAILALQRFGAHELGKLALVATFANVMVLPLAAIQKEKVYQQLSGSQISRAGGLSRRHVIAWRINVAVVLISLCPVIFNFGPEYTKGWPLAWLVLATFTYIVSSAFAAITLSALGVRSPLRRSSLCLAAGGLFLAFYFVAENIAMFYGMCSVTIGCIALARVE